MTERDPETSNESGAVQEELAEEPARPNRCADAARERHDPQLGSAPQARRWLLLEHRGPWQIDALAGSQISVSVLDLLGRTVRRENARPLLIRRPGRSVPTESRSWAVCYEDDTVVWGSWRVDDDLARAADALSSPPPTSSERAEPILLVCTHGLHDVCCALRGRPVAAALATEWPASTWECSHVGGDRFAANVVVLPEGVYYGGLDPDRAVSAVRAHLRGEVPVEHLRGMTHAPPPTQVAIAAVHQRFGPLGARDVEVSDVTLSSSGRWRIMLSAARLGLRQIEVTVAASRRAPAQLTCRAASETSATQYHVVNVTSAVPISRRREDT